MAVWVGVGIVLRPIPARMLHDTAVFHVTTGIDDWQAPTTKDVYIPACHVQPVHEIRKSSANTDISAKGVLFVPGDNPDMVQIAKESEAAGHPLTVTVTTAYGLESAYAVLSVDALPDVPALAVHHWEVTIG